jgi:hypothetical protein
MREAWPFGSGEPLKLAPSGRQLSNIDWLLWAESGPSDRSEPAVRHHLTRVNFGQPRDSWVACDLIVLTKKPGAASIVFFLSAMWVVTRDAAIGLP